jgi:hypothetical protein
MKHSLEHYFCFIFTKADLELRTCVQVFALGGDFKKPGRERRPDTEGVNEGCIHEHFATLDSWSSIPPGAL